MRPDFAPPPPRTTLPGLGVEDGFCLRFWQAGLAEYDTFNGIDWAWMSTDGAMTKAPVVGKKTGPSPVDRSKGGTKRSLCVEGGGVPVALSVAGANRNDFKLLEQTLQSFAQAKPEPTRARPQHLLLDKGDGYDEVRAILQARGLIAHIRSRGEEAGDKQKQLRKKARRWVVERTHGWMNHFRSILTR